MSKYLIHSEDANKWKTQSCYLKQHDIRIRDENFNFLINFENSAMCSSVVGVIVEYAFKTL